MPRYIIKLHDDKSNRDYYMEWSTVVDAPVTYGCSLEEFTKYYRAEYGRQGIAELDERMKRVEEKGIWAHPPFDDLQSLFEYNRAGEDDYYSSYWPKIKHLHQLQNLYFAFTGEELTLNL